jgi:hypothetical protein
MTKPKLIPEKVPWQVSPSTPHLSVSASESERDTIVEANCNLQEADEQRFVRISMNFGRAQHVRTAPSVSDVEVVAEGDYDWSDVQGIDAEDISGSQTRFFATWTDTGICPDPGVYEVRDSEWSKAVGAGTSVRHFLIVGHDSYVEVLAEKLTWQMLHEVAEE